MIEGSGRLARNPSPSDIDAERARWLEDPVELTAEILEPVYVLVFRHIAIIFLTEQCERRTGHDEVDRVVP
jgi:hypothetical protein